MSLIPVEEALRRLLEDARPLGTETVALDQARGRVLAEPLAARRTQPPFAASAMDGYAVRAADAAAPGARLRVIGTAPAGHAFAGRIGPGEAVRIFTGAPVPEGADAILIQENASLVADSHIEVREPVSAGRFVRPRGLDFSEGDTLLAAGTVLGFADVALAAAMNHARLPALRRPTVAVLATGDELVPPGTAPAPDQIVASNSYGIAALTEELGGVAIDLGIVPDRPDAIAGAIERARGAGADVLVTLGGASVGDHDLVQQALVAAGMQLAFWRIAMRPGKPFMVGRLGEMRVLGLPGNPVSSMVCGLVFLRPLLRALGGREPDAEDIAEAVLGRALPENDQRQDYLRARLSRDRDGRLVATPFPAQDSSMLATFARAQGLVIRPPFAPPAPAGAPCRVLLTRPLAR